MKCIRYIIILLVETTLNKHTFKEATNMAREAL
jgi:hypothetical protein